MASRVNWGDVPTWVGAILTGGAAIAALVTLIVYLRTYREDAQVRRQHQAELVSAWVAGEKVVFCNSSNAPIYHAIASLVNMRQATGEPLAGKDHLDNRAYCDPVLPGERRIVAVREHGGGYMGARFAVELAFTDNAGRHWLKPVRGSLREIHRSPQIYYGLGEPLYWDYGNGLNESPEDRR